VTEIDILDREIRWTDDLCVAKWIEDAKAEIRHIRFCHGNVSKMLTEAARIIDNQNKEIAELKTQISFERDINLGREDQLNDDIKFLRSKLPNL